MSALDLAAVLVTLIAFASFVVLWTALTELRRSAEQLTETARAIQRESVPLLRELRDTVAEAGAEVERVDELLEAAETIAAGVESASRLGYLAFRAPLIRIVAFVTGMGRALRRLLPGRRRSPIDVAPDAVPGDRHAA